MCPISTSPSIVTEILVAIMEVLINSLDCDELEVVLGSWLGKNMRVKYLRW